MCLKKKPRYSSSISISQYHRADTGPELPSLTFFFRSFTLYGCALHSLHSFTLLPIPLVLSANNDWSNPCLGGWCAYDIPASENTMAASMIITGSSNSISDITAAAGWEILNCDSNSTEQDIRLVCSGDETSCEHIFESGAEHTVVRLPEDCGSVPFAHVAKAWISEDQSLPSNLSAKLMRRDGTTPTVHALSLNTNFSQAADSTMGNVSLFISGSNIPGAAGNATQQLASGVSTRRRSRAAYRRGLFSDIVNSISDAADKVLGALNNQDINESISLPQSIWTNPSTFSMQLHAQVLVGVVATGHLIPPSISDFAVFSTLTADLEGSLDVSADVLGTVDTGKVPLVTIPIAGFDIPGILTVGPSVSIDGQAVATVDLGMDLAVNLTYKVNNLTLFFPPSDDHKSVADVSPNNTPLKLSAVSDVSANATLEAHLIPSLNVGVSAFGSSASVFLDLDTSATLNLGLDANANASVSTNGTKAASADVDGCVDIKAGVAINAGAEGDFFGIFDKTAQITLFEKEFDIFQKCFSEAAATKRELGGGRSSESLLAKRDFTCSPSFSSANLTALASTLIDDVISAASFVGL
ncbi:hypothetical protein PNOK_0676700 [Pyrrhoderma noxium]|uniref:DUF7223 domain-containing protein n=1 Tax=Pyrrhoderma noxium TaxID=2282107 RepID=A0A286UFA8_9AGAM|nr:hypothetical protein PNOK_0676700 [Pyrrhoderma noxium]